MGSCYSWFFIVFLCFFHSFNAIQCFQATFGPAVWADSGRHLRTSTRPLRGRAKAAARHRLGSLRSSSKGIETPLPTAKNHEKQAFGRYFEKLSVPRVVRKKPNYELPQRVQSAFGRASERHLLERLQRLKESKEKAAYAGIRMVLAWLRHRFGMVLDAFRRILIVLRPF